MKNIKKIFAALMCVQMLMLLVFNSTVSAETVIPATITKGTLTLYKSIPDETKDRDEQTPVSGAKFTAYQIAELSNGKYVVTDNFRGVEGLSALFDSDGGLTYQSTSSVEALIPKLQAQSENVSDGEDGKVYTSTEDGSVAGRYTFGDMDLGVYLVVETTVPNNFITTSQSFLVSIPEWIEEHKEGEETIAGKWNENVVAYPKNEQMSVEKKIVTKDGGAEKDVSEDTKSIGDIVPFKITAKIPDYGASTADPTKKLTAILTDAQFNGIKFNFADTLSKGLALEEASVKVEVIDGVSEGNNYTLQKKDDTHTVLKSKNGVAITGDADYTVSLTPVTNGSGEATGEHKLSVDIAWAALDQYQGKSIVLTYNTVLNENAVIGSENKNTVKLTYTNDPTSSGSTVTDGSETKVYTYGMILTKYFNNELKVTGAEGVEFSLKKDSNKLWFITKKSDAKSGEYIVYSSKMADNLSTEADESVEPTEGKTVTINSVDYIITQKLNCSQSGVLNVKGLNVGTYVLTEEKSIEGYSKLASDVTIVVTKDTSDAKKVAAKMNDTSLANKEDNGGIFLLTVNNVSKQFSLPLTGGAGLLLFTIGGGIIMAGAIIIFYQMRKKKVSE